MKKVGIVSCYFQHNYGSMLQALATQMALDKLGYENETFGLVLSEYLYVRKNAVTITISDNGVKYVV